MQKKLLVILSVLMMASLLLAACGTPATPAATEPPAAATQAPAATEPPAATQAPAATEAAAAGDAKTLKIYLLDYTPDTIAWLKDTINPEFEKAHPGTKVEITEGSWSGWDTTFSGFFAAGDGPDIINLGSDRHGK